MRSGGAEPRDERGRETHPGCRFLTDGTVDKRSVETVFFLELAAAVEWRCSDPRPLQEERSRRVQ